jgi:hypothetical protein
LTLPEIATHLETFTPTPSEPDWFVKAWRGAKGPKDRLAALDVFMGE